MGKGRKDRNWKEWRTKMEQKGTIAKAKPDEKAQEEEEEEENKDNGRETKFSSPSEAGPSLTGPVPSRTLGFHDNPLPTRMYLYTFEERVEKLSQLLCNPNELKGLELVLDRSGLRVSTKLVEEVLKKSYKAGAAAQRFFDWAGLQLEQKHSPYAWNLLVDILGNNQLFDGMWAAVKAMKSEGILSRHTFASVFTCYAMAKRANEAIMTFEVMEQYGCSQDVAAFNCLLCALCRYKQTFKAQEFAKKMGDRFPPDADTYAILLEGWEKEGDVVRAKVTLAEMIARLGWNPANKAAFNAFLGTLCKGGQVDESLKFLHVMRSKNCYPDKSFYSTAIHALSVQNKVEEAAVVFDTMLRIGHLPSTTTYNSIISAYCYCGKVDAAYPLLDGMVWNGAFPDSLTYNSIFQALVNGRRVEEAISIFQEMTRNEFDPDNDSISLAFLWRDLSLATMVWKHLNRKGLFPDMDSVYIFITCLCENGKRGEAKRYVEDMMEKGHKVSDEILYKVEIEKKEKKERKDSHERSSKKRKDNR